MKRLTKVKIIKDSLGLNKEHRKFAGKDAVVLQIDGDTVTLAIDHDGDATTEPIIITVKTKYIEVVSFMWQMWLLMKGLFTR